MVRVRGVIRDSEILPQPKCLRSRKPVSLTSICNFTGGESNDLGYQGCLSQSTFGKAHRKVIFHKEGAKKPKQKKQQQQKGLKNKPNNTPIFLSDKSHISFKSLLSGPQVLRGTTSSLQSLPPLCRAECKVPFLVLPQHF